MVQAEIGGQQQFAAAFPFVTETGEQAFVDTRSAADIVQSGEKLERFEIIPLANVITETPVIDPVHASELAVDMAQGRGQLLPILVRVREDEESGALVYDVADGFHRTAGLKAADQPTIKAVVMYGCTDEELIDKRIISANSVKSVKFGRIALWMNAGYDLTPWAEQGISLRDAVSTAVFNSNSVKGGDLDEAEIQRMKDWVVEKARHWQMPVAELWTNLGIIEQSDPRLVQLVRPKVEKGEEGTVITQANLKMVSDIYPGPENYGVQRALINWFLENRASAHQLEDMAWCIQGLVQVGMKAKEVSVLIADMETRREQAALNASKADDARYDSQFKSNPRRSASTSRRTSAKEFRDEIAQLKWWEKTEGLDEREKNIVAAIFDDRKSLAEAVEQFDISRDEIGAIILSALDKRPSVN